MLEEMDKFFNKRVLGYDEHMLNNIEGAREFYKFTAKQLPMNANCNVLDLGCGTGLELEEYLALNSSANITGIDLSESMLRKLSNKFPEKNLNLINADYFKVILEENQYDAVVSVESLHHFDKNQKLKLYKKLLKTLKLDGYFILTDYFAESNIMERKFFTEFNRLKVEQNLSNNNYFHYDTTLTINHEIQVLKLAGFSTIKVLKNWGATYIINAIK